MPAWLTIDVERLLTVDRGRDSILLDRWLISEGGGTIVVRLNDDKLKKLAASATAAIEFYAGKAPGPSTLAVEADRGFPANGLCRAGSDEWSARCKLEPSQVAVAGLRQKMNV